jgi:hypothetical protein
MNRVLTEVSGTVQTAKFKVRPKFNASSPMEAWMTMSKKRRHSLPAIAFIYLALVGGMVLLSATMTLAI